MDQASELTGLLSRLKAGDESARERLVERVYPELKAMARAQFGAERANHTLQPTALLHEAYLRLVESEHTEWTSRAHFMAVAAKVMRQLLVDSARRKNALKRQAPEPATLIASDHDQDIDLVQLEEALARLEAIAPCQAQVVELKFFGGLTAAEVAAVLNVSDPTVHREWRSARTSLFLQLDPDRQT